MDADDLYSFGDYVVYDDREVGRVAGCDSGECFVCYSNGCIAALTPIDMLRAATEAEISEASPRLGYHRFDAICPHYDESICSNCRARKGE